jgi:hypothetical protein
MTLKEASVDGLSLMTKFVSRTSRIRMQTIPSMKNSAFWDVRLCGFCKNRRFGGSYRLQHDGDKNRQLGTMLAETSNRSTLRRNSHRRENLKSYISSMSIRSVLSVFTGLNPLPKIPFLSVDVRQIM